MLNLTRQERLVIQFLALFFLIGSGIHFYKNKVAHRKVIVFIEQDVEVSEFKERARQIDSVFFEGEQKPGKSGRSMNEQKIFKKVNLNTATAEELMSLSKIGKVTAQRILDYRNEQGLFKSVDELLNVKGIGVKTLERIKGEVTIE